jgi:hypothetical protein
VVSVMLVEASDGNAYLIACDRERLGSNCLLLRAGDTFSARSTSKGLAVQAVAANGKESGRIYSVLQSKALQ